MDFEERWHMLHELGEGGQGKVYRVLDLDKIRTEDMHPKDVFGAISEMIGGFTVAMQASHKNRYEVFKKAISTVNQMDDPANHGALKLLHKPEKARDYDLAKDRIKREIEGMSALSHPNLLKILDKDPDAEWYVSEFHPKGTLTENMHLFTGDIAAALKAFRPLVEGVSELHKQKLVHRDIKPENVFLDVNNNLVLGDFGLVFFTDVQHTRISETFENVGSRDWMPGWGFGMRIEELESTFDVFSLGKLLWAMISDTPILQLWYFDQPQFNLAEKFPSNPHMGLANSLFGKCIVEWENECLPNASALLEEVDNTLSAIEGGADPIDLDIERKCKVCGPGFYKLLVDRDFTDVPERSVGLNPPIGKHRLFTCNHCAHVQWFYFRDRILPPAWAE